LNLARSDFSQITVMNRFLPLASLLALGFAGVDGLAQETQAVAEDASIRVLIVTGMDHPAHDWRATTPALQKELAKDPRMRVEVLEDPYRLDQTDLSKFEVVFLHFNNWERPDPNQAARENLRGFVERGGGLVVLHFACGAFADWPEFSELAGRVWDRKNTHDPRGPFRVELVDAPHPITRGLTSFETDDELYTGLTGKQPITLLAEASSKTTGTDQPMAFTLTYGQGRVFHTPLGHDARAIHTPTVAELIRRGVAWTAGATVAP
jgi:type 1 glutamine amidotransferase